MLQEFYEEHVDEGFTVITALHSTSTTSQLAAWVEEFSSTHPVLGDFDSEVYEQYRMDEFRPQYVLFDRDMTVLHIIIDTPDLVLATTLSAL